jgi:hypothetical protein
MHIVGSDRIVVAEGRVEPAELRHAVDLDGQTVCRPRPLAYVFPALDWDPDAPSACPTCIDTIDEQQAFSVFDAYPSMPTAAVNLLAGTA